MQFEKNLVLLRKRKNLSQEELAFAIGVTRQTIYTWEAGLNYPNIQMLKKIADVLEASTDDLLKGLEVNKLPSTFKDLKLTYVGKYDGTLVYDELPNWFIKLKPEEEVCWALYDLKNGLFVRDYSYYVKTLGDVKVHDIDGLEIEVKEYKPDLSFSKVYNQYISIKDDGVAWIGEAYYKDDKKIIRTYKDQEFLNDWGYNKELIYQKMKYDNAENYILEYNGTKQKVIKISYFDPDGRDDLKAAYFEVILNHNYESLVWRRYTKLKYKLGTITNDKITIDNEIYDCDYYCITSRL